MHRLWTAWKRLGKRLADIQVRGLLIFFYFFVFSPFALVIRWWSDPLAIKSAAPKGWRLKTQNRESAEIQEAMRQF